MKNSFVDYGVKNNRKLPILSFYPQTDKRYHDQVLNENAAILSLADRKNVNA